MQEISVYDSSGAPIESLVQWDSDVYIYIQEPEITQAYNVHFFNGLLDKALVVNSTYANSKLKVKIPNTILTYASPMIGYVHITNAEGHMSLFRFRINISKKPEPSDHLHVDTDDYINIEDILDECRESQAEAAKSASAASASQTAAKASEDAAKASQAAAAASQTAAKTSETNAKSSADAAKASQTAAAASESNASKSETTAKSSQTAAANSATAADASATESEEWAKKSQGWAEGGTATHENEETNNSKYWATQSQTSATAAAASQKAAASSETAAKTSENAAKSSQTAAASSQSAAATSATQAASSASAASTSAKNADTSAKTAQSYAVGTGGVRENEAQDNAAYYYERAREIAQGLGSPLIPIGTVKFEELPTDAQTGYMYNISDAFTSDNRFEEGTGHAYPAGTNIYYTASKKWDALVGPQVTGIKGSAEATMRQGNVTLSPANLGLENVDNTHDNAKNVLSATKLTTARSLKTNLESTAAVTFDGSADQNSIPVTGTLPIGSGGTGKTTASEALTALGGVPTSRTVNSKALTGNITLSAGDVGAYTKAEVDSKVTAVTSHKWNITVNTSNWVSATDSWAGTSAKFSATLACTGMTTSTDITGINFTGGDQAAAATWAYLRPNAGSVTLYSETKPAANFTLELTEVK